MKEPSGRTADLIGALLGIATIGGIAYFVYTFSKKSMSSGGTIGHIVGNRMVWNGGIPK